MGSITVPFGASGPRSSTKRPRGIPPAVRAAVVKMCWQGCDRVEAARAVGLQFDTLRRWLHRPEVVSFQRRESAARAQAEGPRNIHVLVEIRDGSTNEMARVHAIKLLELIREEVLSRHASETSGPGVTIRIINQAPQQVPIDITPRPSQIIDAVANH